MVEVTSTRRRRAPSVVAPRGSTVRRLVVPIAIVGAAGCSSVRESSEVATATTEPAPTAVVIASPATSPATGPATSAPPPSTAGCPTYRSEQRGTLPASLAELSGWALSTSAPDVLWAHNDSGDEARLVAVSTVDGSLLAEVTVADVLATDWEDIATSVDDDGRHWILVADTGDNAEERGTTRLVVVEEPPLDATVVDADRVVDVEWAGGPHDVEAMLVDPSTGDAIFVGKRFGDVAEVPIDRIAAADLAAGGTVVAERTGTFPVPGLQPYGPTAASIDRSGQAVGLLFYGNLTQLWERAPGASVADTITGAPTCTVGTGLGQYEALALADDGTVYVASEGSGVPLEVHVPIAP